MGKRKTASVEEDINNNNYTITTRSASMKEKQEFLVLPENQQGNEIIQQQFGEREEEEEPIQSDDYNMDEADDYYDEHEINNDDDDYDDDNYSHNDEDDDAEVAGFQSVSAPQRKLFQTEFSVRTASQIKDEISTQISSLCDLLGLSFDDSKILLQKYRWNKEQLVERYMEDSDKVLKDASLSIDNPSSNSTKFELKSVTDGEPLFTCPICYSDSSDDPQIKIVSAVACGHCFCFDCYFQFLKGKIMDEGDCRAISCPASACNVTLPDHFITDLLHKRLEMNLISTSEHSQILGRFERLSFQSYVDDIKELRWCPSPNCDQLIHCTVHQSQLKAIVPIVTCSNNHTFCFGCSYLGDHQPSTCSMTRIWLKKLVEDSETSNWIASFTKECAKCQSTIEKNGGCNHMTCKKCKYEFCWVCMGPWAEHGTSYYNCNRFEEKASKEARELQAKSRAQLERYLHYFNRYNNHEQSAKLANNHYEQMEQKMERIQKSTSFSWIEVQFMRKALNVILECRNTLKWTYCFAYYLERSHMADLFEDNQRDLEMAVESLNELIEQPIPGGESDEEIMGKLIQMKQTCLDKTEYCSKRREVLLEDSARGLLEERWTFNQQL